MRHRVCTRLAASLLTVTLFATSTSAQTQPSARIQRTEVIRSNDGKAQAIEISFLIKTAFVVDGVDLFYRPVGAAEYTCVALSRNPELLYVGIVSPIFPRMQYYLQVRPERGSTIPIASANSPLLLNNTEDLLTKNPRSRGK